MEYLVLYRDVDPDTGIWSVTKKLCSCDEIGSAESIAFAMRRDDPEPNREYIIEKVGKKESVILCADPDQIEMAWKCQNWIISRKVGALVCFSPEEVSQIREIYENYGIPHMVAVVSQDREKWSGVNYDLRLGEFTEDDFEVILDVME